MALADALRMIEWKSNCRSGQELISLAQKAAGTRLAVALFGETGVGKEVLARSIHGWSELSKGPFIPVNCSALPGPLAESELFGHVRGAFTGAMRTRAGACFRAREGTLFLDEVADLAPEIQPKLLRFLEDGEIRAVGSDEIQKSNARVICATHKPLSRLVATGQFRRDLYFRLTSIILEIPSIRDRSQDLELLATEFAASHGKQLSPDGLAKIKSHFWPGNVRELKHAIDRAAALSSWDTQELHARDFCFLRSCETDQEVLEIRDLDIHSVNKAVMIRALQRTGGHRGHAAKIMGVARSTFFELMKKYDVVDFGRPGGT